MNSSPTSQTNTELAKRLRALAETLPKPWDEDRSYTDREIATLQDNVAVVLAAAITLERRSGPAEAPVAWIYRFKGTTLDTLSNQPPDRTLDADKYEITPLYTRSATERSEG